GPWPPRWPRPGPTPRAPPTASGRPPRARHAFSASELSSLGTRRVPTRGTGEHVVLEVLVVVTTRSLLIHEPDDGGLFSLRLEHDRLHVRLLGHPHRLKLHGLPGVALRGTLQQEDGQDRKS